MASHPLSLPPSLAKGRVEKSHGGRTQKLKTVLLVRNVYNVFICLNTERITEELFIAAPN